MRKLRLPLIAAILAVVQFYIIKDYYLYTGWDAIRIWEAVEGNANAKYFSMYPNNLFLVWLYRTIIKIATGIGFWEGYSFLILIAFQCIVCQFSGVILYLSAKELSGETAAVTVYVLYELIVGLSPWISVPYSDATALVFPITIFFLATRKSDIKWLAIGLLSYFAYSVKPQAVIICIAAVIIMLRKPKNILIFVAGFAVSVFLANVCISSLDDINVDSEKSVSVAHYLMMGMNERTEGKYAEEDAVLASGFPTYKERAEAELGIAFERIHKMGFIGTLKQMLVKTKNAFTDGTFWWHKEGHFVFAYMPEHGKFFRNLYYPVGKYYKIWEGTENVLWLTSVFTAVISIFNLKKKDKHINTLLLGALGIIAFNALFEERSRYIFCNIPIILLMTSMGLNYISKIWRSKRQTSANL